MKPFLCPAGQSRRHVLMSNMPATLSYQQAVGYVDPGAVAAAESVKARIQASFIMAMQRPRNYMESRTRILDACKRPEFAQRVEYAKPQGKKQDENGRWVNNIIKGPSIRFAELAVREWGNVNTETQIVYEDDYVRRIKVTVIDLETNATFGKEAQIKKTVERKDKKGREVVSERLNSYGDPVFIVLATDEELANKEAAMVSKIIRNEGLRLIPQDIIDEGIATARKTLGTRDAQDPKAALKNIVDHFASLNIGPKQLELYLGHGLDIISPAELQDLRGIYQAIAAKEASWSDYVARESKDDLNDLLGKKPEPKSEPPKQEKKAEPEPQSAPGPEPKNEPAPEPVQMKPEGQKAPRRSKEEMDGLRFELVEEIAAEGLDLKYFEDKVKAFSNQWSTAQMDTIRNVLIPNMKAEKAGLV
ncbi:MAG: hypothetical protein V3573_14645 [Desulfovibrionaceae bacterium]